MTQSSGRRGIAGVISSPRQRRRLRWVAVLLAAGAAAVVAVIFMPDQSSHTLPSTPTGTEQAAVVPPPPKTVKIGKIDRVAARETAAKFVATAVLRRHLEQSWDLAAPELRAGFTRKAWMTGSIPVVPFPADQLESVRYHTDYTIKGRIGYQVAMLPHEGSSVQAVLFSMELERRGPPANHQWMVDYWTPISPGTLSPAQRAKQAQELANAAPQPVGSGWLLLPIAGIFALIVTLPVFLLVRGMLRNRRAERAYRETQTSSSSPS
jgi:hypothetical protein